MKDVKEEQLQLNSGQTIRKETSDYNAYHEYYNQTIENEDSEVSYDRLRKKFASENSFLRN
jgi:hypothetical protein